MTSPVPVNPNVKSSSFTQEPNTFSSVNDLYQFFQPKILRVSKQSPPVLGVDITEGQLLWDRTANRLYTVSNGVLKYAAFS